MQSYFDKRNVGQYRYTSEHPRTCPSKGVISCTYARWFQRPLRRCSRPHLIHLTLPADIHRLFFRFRSGCSGLPIDTGRHTGVPRASGYAYVAIPPLYVMSITSFLSALTSSLCGMISLHCSPQTLQLWCSLCGRRTVIYMLWQLMLLAACVA
jgi:hypothetical protein